MTFLVPFDGSAASEAALARAVDHGAALGESVVAVSFVPTGDTHAQRRRWVEPDEEFAVEQASADLNRKISEATDDAERQYSEVSAETLGDGVADEVRGAAHDVDATVVFVGVDGADDRMTTPFGDVAAEGPYDIHLVRTDGDG